MGQVLVRNLDDRVIESFRAKAELKGCSLEQELRDVLTKAAPLTPEDKIALFRKLRAMTPPLEDVDVRAAIRRGRDDEFDCPLGGFYCAPCDRSHHPQYP
jgi:plasmid stability protein